MLAIENITFERNNHVLFENLNCTLPPGTLLQVTGENGIGKSTLLRICAGYIEPLRGKILRPQRWHYLGHQNGLKQSLTVWENLQLNAALADVTFHSQAALEVLEQFNLIAVIHTQIRLLSAGQCRRAALARLLLQTADLWILDEPTTALDAAGHVLLLHVMQQHLSSNGSIVLATHQPVTAFAVMQTLHLGEPNV